MSDSVGSGVDRPHDATDGPRERDAPGSGAGHGRNGPGREETAVLGGGCFWCTEAVFKRTAGVKRVEPGYAGGTKPDPSYEEVCTGRTGHAEVVRVTFDPDTITYDQILDVFFKTHDPTTLNRQGADLGTQYRSIVLYLNEAQRSAAEAARDRAQRELYDDPVVTEIRPLERFYEAEEYHRDYYDRHPYAGYCSVVIRPKLKKLSLE
jgi:peptide-methionine (S)-S-oxide reductase